MSKWKPINALQLVMMAAMVTAPIVGKDWPASATWMQIVVAAASAILGTVSLYAPPLQTSQLLGPQGLQTVHVVQGIITTVISLLASVAATQPGNASLAEVTHVATTLGGVFAGVFGLFSPQAYLGPIAQARLHRMVAASRQAAPSDDDLPETPRDRGKRP